MDARADCNHSQASATFVPSPRNIVTLLYVVPGSALANGFWPWESFAKDTWNEFEGGVQNVGRGHSCHVEMLNNRMKISSKPTKPKKTETLAFHRK